ncbi:MAG: hypothetical protein QOG04_1399 [Actinomycetota bacterium]|jgi:uncharacterized protein (DUF1015 family)|nr:hypothetical protein [Actinomycetota bacterium]
MPELKPFKGIRYSSSADLKDLTCPPYDVISPEEQDRLHERHPNNAVRLELARAEGGGEKYRNVAATFQEWMAQGVLEQDTTESLYVYRQDFKGPDGTRRRVAGVIGALELEPFGNDSGVLPHEQTMAGPKADRLALMNALPVNVSPIFAIYRGDGGLAPFLDALGNRPTDARVADDQGILHRLWVIRAPAEITMIRDALRPGPLVIADGHHRYETALAFHQERDGEPGDHGSIMCFCVDADSEGLVVLPYNRAARGDLDDPARHLEDGFGATPVTASHEEVLRASRSDHPLVFVTKDGDLLVEVSDDQVVEAVGDRHPAWRALDVVALHQVVFPKLFADEPELVFSKDDEHIRKLVADGWTAGVLLRAMSAAAIVDVAGSGERMPQKASYFWPKAVTGLVFHSLS